MAVGLLTTVLAAPGGLSGDDKGDAVAVGGNHRLFVTGESFDTGDGYDIATIGYNASTGGVLWTRQYNGPGDGDDAGYDVTVTPDKTKVVVTGQAWSADADADLVAISYLAHNGSQQWAVTYEGAGDGYDSGVSGQVSPDGNLVFVAGDSYTGATNGVDVVVLALDMADGSVEWSYNYDGFDGVEDVSSLVVSPDGNRVYVAGGSDASGTTNDDLFVIALDTADGSQEWVYRYNGADSLLDKALALDVSSNNARIFATGFTRTSANGNDFVTVGLSSAGAELWTDTYNGPGDAEDIARGIDVSPNGTRVFVAGQSTGGSSTNSDFYTISYRAANGDVEWAHRQNRAGNPQGDDPDYGNAIVVSPDGTDVYTAGGARGVTGLDFYTVAYDADAGGSPLGTHVYDGPAALIDEAFDIDVRPNGNRVYVVGQSYGLNNNFDYATVSIDTSNGNGDWARRYDNGDHDIIIV